jgi:hypothetical protein
MIDARRRAETATRDWTAEKWIFFHPNFTIHPPDARRKRVLTRQMFRHVNSLFASVLNDR